MDVAEVIKIQNQIASKIEELRGRIGTHRGYLTGSETRTRQLLIDPMLRVLEWDIENPEQVHLEYPVSGGRVDYALMHDGNPIAVVEAKSLSRTLDDSVTVQVLSYITDKSTIKYAIATNGDSWQMRVKGGRNKTFDIRIAGRSDYETALEMMRISRSVLQPDEEKMIAPVPPPMVGPCPPPEVSGSEVGWIPLTSVSGLNKDSSMPEVIKFPDGSSTDITYGVDLLRQTVKWLVNTGKLNSTHTPVTRPGATSSRYIWNRQPEHSNGRPFNNPEEIGDGVWVEKDLTAQQAVDNATLLLGNYGVNANEVQVKQHTA